VLLKNIIMVKGKFILNLSLFFVLYYFVSYYFIRFTGPFIHLFSFPILAGIFFYRILRFNKSFLQGVMFIFISLLVCFFIISSYFGIIEPRLVTSSDFLQVFFSFLVLSLVIWILVYLLFIKYS